MWNPHRFERCPAPDAGLAARFSQGAYQYRGLLEEQGRLAEALDHFRRAVDLVPDDARALDNLVIALARAGRVDEVRIVLDQAQHYLAQVR